MTKHLVLQGPVMRNVRKDFPGKGRFHDKSVGWYLRNIKERWIKGTHVVDDMVERFRAACQLQTDKGFIENTVRGMPGQMKKLIEKEGGRTGK